MSKSSLHKIMYTSTSTQSMEVTDLGDLRPSELPGGFSSFMNEDFDTLEYEKNPGFGQQMRLGFRSIEV